MVLPSKQNNISKFLNPEAEEDSYIDMYNAALELEPFQRAMMAQYYYQRVHLRELGLRISATCEFHILQRVFGSGAEIIYEQSEKYLRDQETPAEI